MTYNMMTSDIVTPCHPKLNNPNAQCYINTFLQCMSATVAFRKYLIYGAYKGDLLNNIIGRHNEQQIYDCDRMSHEYKHSVTHKLRNVISEMCNDAPNDNDINRARTEFITQLFSDDAIKNFELKKNQQSDCSELFTFVVDRIHNETKSDVLVTFKNLSEDVKRDLKNINKLKEHKKSDGVVVGVVVGVNVIINYFYKKNRISKEEIFYKIQMDPQEEREMKKDYVYSKNFTYNIFVASLDFWRDALDKSHSPMIDIFGGLNVDIISCSGCNILSHKFQYADMLPIPLHQNKHSHDLYDYLNDYFNETQLNETICKKCGQCKIKKPSIWFFPNIMVIQLIRFGDGNRKDKRNIHCPLKLDMSMHQCKYNPLNDCTEYNLYAIACHQGNILNSGHYYAIAKENDKWYECNDYYYIKEISNIENRLNSEEIYLLFYEKNKSGNFHINSIS